MFGISASCRQMFVRKRWLERPSISGYNRTRLECWLWKRSPRFGLAFFVQKKPTKKICRELRISRRAVRKIVRSDATEFRYERSRQPLPKIGPWRDRLDCLLRENGEKPAQGAPHGIIIAPAYVPLTFAPGEAY